MNRNKLKTYAPQARRDFIKAVTDRAAFYGLMKDKVEPVVEQGDVAIIAGKPFPRAVAAKRKRLEERIRRQGFDQVMEAMAYTWFNRFVAIRYMELHGYLDHGYRVLSTTDYTDGTDGKNFDSLSSVVPEILKHAEHMDMPGLDREKVIELKLEGTKEAELYRMLLIAQCNALHKAMPFLFERVDDETELLLPDNLLHSDSLIRKLVNEIPEADWQEIEIIGWLYQFYISEKKDEVIGKVVKSEDIPAATQLFTPNWIVKYMVQNTLGRQWMVTYPHSSLKEKMEFYIEPAEQTPEVQEQLKAITPDSLNPEELTLLDPACGSGHILVEAYDLLKAIYQERGYRTKDIPRLILQKNLCGLEIDDRAAQLAAFALMMKARADDRRIFENGARPHVLAIQESKGLKAKEITEALNAPILKAKLPPREFLFEEMEDERAPLFSRKNLSVKGDIAQADVAQLIELFEHGKTFGSLIRVTENLAEKLPAIAETVKDVLAYSEMFGQAAARALRSLVEQAMILAGTYDAVVTNPPYLGNKGMNATLKSFARKQYPRFKADTFAMFIDRAFDLAIAHGRIGLMTPFVWMFIRTYKDVRRKLIEEKSLHSLVHPEYHAFFESAYVPICAFVANNFRVDFSGCYFDLRQFYGADEQPRRFLEAINSPKCSWRYVVPASEFTRIPGEPIVYWLHHELRMCFTKGLPLVKFAEPRIGMATCDNDTFLRLWTEVSLDHIQFGCPSREAAIHSRKRWFPHQKGGEFRRWYGNLEYVVNWENDGYLLQTTKHPTENRVRAHNFNLDYIFRPAIVWTSVTSSLPSFRYSEEGCLYDAASGLCHVRNSDDILIVLGLLNSKLVLELQPALNPTLNLVPGDLCRIPVIKGEGTAEISSLVEQMITVSKEDWNQFETAWEFSTLPLLSEQNKCKTITASYSSWGKECRYRTDSLRNLEEETNRLFIMMYGLQEVLSLHVPEDQITIYRPNREDDIKRLVSYAIGCMMGRYSLDKPGLIYAHSGDERFWEIYHEKHEKAAGDQNENNSRHSCDSWSSSPPDQDGIIPVTDTDTDWFPDDATNRVVEFIAVAWPREHLEENLKFVAESLGTNRGESSRETIRRYLSTGFYKHHLSMYKRRPIYWLFSSGKQRAFQCLVYSHRYNEGTLSRMRTEYVIPLQGKISARIDHLEADSKAATSTSHGKKLQRERDKLVKQQAELQTFDEKLRHYADKRISLDLDDGVKVNYGKFGDLLAEVKAVTGKKKK